MLFDDPTYHLSVTCQYFDQITMHSICSPSTKTPHYPSKYIVILCKLSLYVDMLGIQEYTSISASLASAVWKYKHIFKIPVFYFIVMQWATFAMVSTSLKINVFWNMLRFLFCMLSFYQLPYDSWYHPEMLFFSVFLGEYSKKIRLKMKLAFLHLCLFVTMCPTDTVPCIRIYTINEIVNDQLLFDPPFDASLTIIYLL